MVWTVSELHQSYKNLNPWLVSFHMWLDGYRIILKWKEEDFTLFLNVMERKCPVTCCFSVEQNVICGQCFNINVQRNFQLKQKLNKKTFLCCQIWFLERRSKSAGQTLWKNCNFSDNKQQNILQIMQPKQTFMYFLWNKGAPCINGDKSSHLVSRRSRYKAFL